MIGRIDRSRMNPRRRHRILSMALLVLLIVASAVQFIPSAQAVWNEQDYVDNNTSDVGAPTDRGTHSNFPAEQAGPDSTYDTLTEADTDTGTSTIGKTSGTGTSYTTVNANEMYGGVFTATSSGEVASAVFYGRRAGGTNVNVKAVITDSSGNILTNGVSDTPASVTQTVGSYTASWAGAKPIVQNGQTYWVMFIGDGAFRFYYDSTTGGTSRSDTTNSYATPTSPTDASSITTDWRLCYANINNLNYELDLEVQWTNVNYTKKYEYLCIYAGSTGSENILVDVWTGAGWQNVIADLNANAWNNVSVATWLTGSTFTMRYKGGTETGDSSQDTWQIDCALLHTWIDQIDNVEAGGPYNVGETISVTWSNYDEFGSGENYINVEYIDQDLSQQIALHSLAKTATSDTYGPIGSAQAGHTIQVWVYTASGATDNHNSAITKGNPWPETCTVNSGAAEFPHGASLLLLLVPVAYLIIRRRSASHTMPRTDRRVMR